MLRIRIPPSGFIEVAEEADIMGRFDESLQRILFLLQNAARKRDAKQTHLLTVSLHAFLHYKGGNYSLTTKQPRSSPAAEAPVALASRRPSEKEPPPSNPSPLHPSAPCPKEKTQTHPAS